MDTSDVCVVIPVYNEAGVLSEVIERVLRSFDRVVCVDDGSVDGSGEIVLATKARLVRHPQNLGQGAAIQTGIEFALLDPAVRYFVTFDADGQHRVEDALSMLAVIREGEADIVFGSRFLGRDSNVSALRRALLKSVAFVTSFTTGVRLSDAHNGLRVFNRRFAQGLDLQTSGMAHASEIVSVAGQGGFRYLEHPVTISYTEYSRSKGQPLLNSVNIVIDLISLRSRP